MKRSWWLALFLVLWSGVDVAADVPDDVAEPAVSTRERGTLVAGAAPGPDPQTGSAASSDASGGATSSTSLEGVTIKGVHTEKARGKSLSRERLSGGVVDAISKEEIILYGDSNASDVARRVTGISVQDDVIVVRGLGNRYSNTLVNGAAIPSPDPSRRVISLDLFPTDLLGDFAIQKTYSPMFPGDFGGGVTLIDTRPIPPKLQGRLRVGVGANSQTTFSPFLTYPGSVTDPLGADSGFRAIPPYAATLTHNGQIPLNDFSTAQVGQVSSSLKNVWNPQVMEAAPVDSKLGIRVGDRYSGPGQSKFGYEFAAVYGNQWRYRNELQNVLRNEGNAVGIDDTQNLQRNEQTITSGGLLDLGFEFNPDHSIELVSLLARNTLKGTYYADATAFGEQLDQRRVTLDWIESQLISEQLTGKHHLALLGGMDAKWQVVYSTASRDVLDRRTYQYTRNAQTGQGDGLYRLALGRTSEGTEPRRLWEFLDDRTLDLGPDFSIPLNLSETWTGSFKLGGRATLRHRDFNSVRWGYVSTGGRDPSFEAILALPSPEAILRPEFYGPGGFQLINVNSLIAQGGNANVYTADQDIYAGYGMFDLFAGSSFEIQLGTRYEASRIDVVTGDPAQGATVPSRLDNGNFLPALNATWFISQRQQLRFGVSKTVNRPQFRELTPVEFLDPETRFLTTGNPDLQQADIVNLDTRWEYYWEDDTGVSVAAFYKRFDKPIEVNIRSTSGGLPVRSFFNVPSATDYGLELDGRAGFSNLGLSTAGAPWLSRFYVGGNLALIQSQVKLQNGGTRQLQGQSPWVVNTNLGYSDRAAGTEAVLLFNMFGDRIAEVGFDGLPNAIQRSYPILDFNLRQRFGKSWLAALKLRNLLDPKIRVEQGNQIQRAYQLGISGELSLQYRF
jgi:Outer membrane receptor proteins, mostly Fe transport